MRKLIAVAAFLLATTAAQAQYTFEYGGMIRTATARANRRRSRQRPIRRRPKQRQRQ